MVERCVKPAPRRSRPAPDSLARGRAGRRWRVDLETARSRLVRVADSLDAHRNRHLRRAATVQEPELGRDIVTLNMVKDVAISDADVSLTIELTTPACPLKDEIERNIHSALGAIWARAR